MERKLKQPALYIEGELEERHPCDQCIVMLNGMDQKEHCADCPQSEALLYYVKPELRTVVEAN